LRWHHNWRGGVPEVLGVFVPVFVVFVANATIFHGLNFLGVMVTITVLVLAAGLELLATA